MHVLSAKAERAAHIDSTLARVQALTRSPDQELTGDVTDNNSGRSFSLYCYVIGNEVSMVRPEDAS